MKRKIFCSLFSLFIILFAVSCSENDGGVIREVRINQPELNVL